MGINELEATIENYRINNYNLSSEIRPVLQLSSTAVLLIIGPAPGIRAHKTGIPWNDYSGDRLRLWLGLSKKEFYDKTKIALISMNFWYTGVNKNGGDNPPNVASAELWTKPLLALMPNIKLTLLIGSYAQGYYLKEKAKSSLTETVQAWREYLPECIVLPHPSWHNNAWIKNHKWFKMELIPELQERVMSILK